MPNIAETAQNPSSWLGKALGWMQSPQRTQQVQGIGKSIQSGLSNIQDADRRYQYLQSKAFSDPRNPLLVTDKNALKELTDMTMSGPLGFAPAGLTVWHGSPHKFDKFDASKIGTGEGAQAYGHGLYLAENPEVAKQYAGMNPASSVRVLPNGNQFDVVAVHDSGPLREVGTFSSKAEAQKIASEYTGANHYKVDLPDDQIARMLDWDKPLSQQSKEVQKMLEPLGYSSKAQVSQYDDDLLAALNGNSTAPLQQIRDPMGADIARGGGLFDSKDQIAKAKRLQELGIPGIRYLDQGSRGAGSGSSNFVVFPGNENILQILERNGNPVNQAISEFNNNLQSFIASRIK